MIVVKKIPINNNALVQYNHVPDGTQHTRVLVVAKSPFRCDGGLRLHAAGGAGEDVRAGSARCAGGQGTALERDT